VRRLLFAAAIVCAALLPVAPAHATSKPCCWPSVDSISITINGQPWVCVSVGGSPWDCYPGTPSPIRRPGRLFTA
jgi:hypothetical protein